MSNNLAANLAMPNFGAIDAQWARLSQQLHGYNSVIAIEREVFAMWGHNEQQFILQAYMYATGGVIPTLVNDRDAPRVFLGPLAMFQQGAMQLQAPFQLPGMPQGPQRPVPSALQAITPAAHPQVAGHAVARDAHPQDPAYGVAAYDQVAHGIAPIAHDQVAHGIAPIANGQVAQVAPVAHGRVANGIDPAVAHGNARAAGAVPAEVIAGVRRGRNPDRVPRPMNCWILYRKHFHPTFKAANTGLSNNQLSTLISAQWHGEPQEVKQYWFNKAQEHAREHARDHPDYRYTPRKPAERRRRNVNKKASTIIAETAARVEAIANAVDAGAANVAPVFVNPEADAVNANIEAIVTNLTAASNALIQSIDKAHEKQAAQIQAISDTISQGKELDDSLFEDGDELDESFDMAKEVAIFIKNMTAEGLELDMSSIHGGLVENAADLFDIDNFEVFTNGAAEEFMTEDFDGHIFDRFFPPN